MIGLIGAVRTYERVVKRNKLKPDDLLFPQHHRDQLNNLLNDTGMKHDALGNIRNARSFRSTYIMFRLIYGTPIKDVATNCGNSTTVIDKFYAKYITPTIFPEMEKSERNISLGYGDGKVLANQHHFSTGDIYENTTKWQPPTKRNKYD